MKAEERARKIVGRLCAWIRPSDEEYIVEQIREAATEQRERDAGRVEDITLKNGPDLIPDYNSDFVKGWNAALGNAQEAIRDDTG